jgi:anhydro-N-acetylmuramic acid kinase
VKRLDSINNKRTRRVLGLISGTSADGVDAALVEIDEADGYEGIRLIHTVTMAYPVQLRQRLLEIDSGGAGALCELNYEVGEWFAEVALRTLEEAGIETAQCDLIGSHGQTVCHVSDGERRSTLQIGEPAIIAEKTGTVTVSDFRAADIAAGGEGAPLVPLADYYLFRPDRGSRLLLNIGGIANLTVLAPDKHGVRGFDTGPGNALIDLAVRSFTGSRMAFDGNGEIARKGRPHPDMLREVMDHPYLGKKPPKSTGLDVYGRDYLNILLEKYGDLSFEDFVCTLTCFTARSIAKAIREFVPLKDLEGDVHVGGGGFHNGYLKEILGDEIQPMRIVAIEELGIPVDYREAIAFAILANETIEGRPGNLTAVTGAGREVVLGKISCPLLS